MRRFKLINVRNEEWAMDTEESFLQNPSGLGLRRRIESVSAGYDWIETQNQLEQQTVSGEIVLKGYRMYQEFVRFCSLAPLILCYMPLDKWYYRNCTVEILEKTEINMASSRMICPVDFLCTSAWYDRVTASKTAMDPTHGKIYPYSYSYIYTETSAGSAEINNTAMIVSPGKLHILGPVINPSWTMLQDGVVTATGKVQAAIPEGHKLVVDASPATMEIAEYTISNEYVQSLYGQSDFATPRFLYFPPGKTKITFTHEGTGAIDAWIEVKQLATTV